MQYKYLFGPVPSRRLGISLGIDLIPFKTCSLNCIYCECGDTTNLTLERKEYVPTDEVIKELDDYLKNQPKIDYITFSGSGEPTLHCGIGKIVAFIKNKYSKYSIALLTNSTMLSDKNLQKEIEAIDLICPSLDAISEEIFNKINQPCKSLNNSLLINGLIDFRKSYKGKIWIEIFIITGINDNENELKLFKEVLLKINPDKIQLNSLDRPGTEDWVKKAAYEELVKIQNYFAGLPVEIIAKYENAINVINDTNDLQSNILALLQRRPCTIEDIINVTGLTQNIIMENLFVLIQKGLVEKVKQDRGWFYKVIAK